MTYLISNLNLDNNSVIPLPQFKNLWAVQKLKNEITLISNSCLHRGSIIINKKQPFNGTSVCPIHKWSYDQKGNLLGKPFDNASGCLETFKTSTWNNLVFKGDFKGIDFPHHLKDYFDMSNFVHTKTDIMKINSSWEIFMEIYLDLYHVEPYHQGLGSFVDLKNYKWHFGKNWSLQEVSLNKDLNKTSNRYFDQLKKLIISKYPETSLGALWFAIYPNIMIEWYANTIIVSSVWPGERENECLNVIEYHHLDSVVSFDQEFLELQLEVYKIAADEDAEACELIQNGRIRDRKSYPTHPVLEKGIIEFYKYIDSSDISNFFTI
jgi:choline monooxygenase